MGKNKTNGPRYDSDGARLIMRKKDYMADMGGQFALGLMANLVGQLTYFYTDKVGAAVGGVGMMLLIAKVIDAFTDVIVGNMVDHSKGGDRKYYSWMIRLAIPAAVMVVAMFTVPAGVGDRGQLAYILITNLLISAVLYTMIATPFAAVMVVRTNSNQERSVMGTFRAIGNYSSGMIIAILTIPITNALGGTQIAWIKYGIVIACICLLLFFVCYRNGVKTKFASEMKQEETGHTEAFEEHKEEEHVSFRDAVGMLFRNRYWIIVLLFNLITSISTGVAAASGTYYCKWIFGNDNLVAAIGGLGLLATCVGFALSQPIIRKAGIKRTIYLGLLGAAAAAGIRCIMPENFTMYMVTSLIGSFIQIPLMCLYGVLTAMTVDFNEWKYGKRLVAVSGGAISFGSKVGGGVAAAVLALLLQAGQYDASLTTATDSMKWSIYTVSNYLPLITNLVMFLIFTRFDLEKRLPQMRREVEARRSLNAADQ